MENEIQKSKLISICEHGFESLNFSLKWKKNLLAGIYKLVDYMGKNNLDVYTESIGVDFIAQLSEKSSNMERIIGRAIYLLESFMEGRKYTLVPSRKSYYFPGDIGVYSQRFIKKESLSKRLSSQTVKTYTAALSRFSVAMEIRQVALQTMRRQDNGL